MSAVSTDLSVDLTSTQRRDPVDDMPARLDHYAMATALTEGFAEAVQAAIKSAHDAGLAVAGCDNGVPVERLPDGTIRPIDNVSDWSPTDWRRHG